MGMWSQRYLRWAMEVLGPERILFSSDYPYRMTPNGGARRFLEEADLSTPHRSSLKAASIAATGARRRRHGAG